MYQKEERVGIIVYLYYNRDVKKVAAYGDIVYHSKKRRYLQLYVPKAQAEDLQKKLEQEKFVKKFVLVIFRNWTKTSLVVYIAKRKTLSFKNVCFYIDNFLIIRYILTI